MAFEPGNERAQRHVEKCCGASLIAGGLIEGPTYSFVFGSSSRFLRIAFSRYPLSTLQHSPWKVFGANFVAGALQRGGQNRLTQFADIARVEIRQQAIHRFSR